jgi:putative membrane protein
MRRVDSLRNRLYRWEPRIALVMVLFFLVGFIGHRIPATLPWMLALTPYFLLIFGLAAFLPVLLEARTWVLIWAGVVLLVTLALEALGTATGWIFGPYTYGSTLGLRLFQVPLVIAFNWLLVILAALLLTRRLFRHPLLGSLAAAALAAGFDYVMEPTAIRLGYWTWQAAGIPPQNYLAWFLIALAAALGFMLPRLHLRSRLPMFYGAIQLVFFATLRLFPPT